MSNLPSFCADTWSDIGDGFFFTEPPPRNIADPQHLEDVNPWVALACATARLREGDFDVFPFVVEAMLREDDLFYWWSAGELFAHAAPPSAVRLLTRAYPSADLTQHAELVHQYCEILCHSLNPAVLPRVTDLLLSSMDDEDVRVLVPEYLSHVWEDEPGPIADGPEVIPDPERLTLPSPGLLDAATYERLLRNFEPRARSAPPYLLGGEPFSVRRLAMRMRAHVLAGEDSLRTNFERMAFEANTGISCRAFFRGVGHRTILQPLVVAATVEEFLDSPESWRFEEGQRYFFGHRIPQ